MLLNQTFITESFFKVHNQAPIFAALGDIENKNVFYYDLP